MKTYIGLIRKKITGAHNIALVLVVAAFGLLTINQYANQQQSLATAGATIRQVRPTGPEFRLNAAMIGTKIIGDTPQAPAPQPAVTSQAKSQVAQPASIASVSKAVAAPAAVPSVAPGPAPAPAGSDIASEAICPGQSNMAALVTVLVCMTSYARTQYGLSPVTAQASLMAAAQAKTQDMQRCGYSHTACGRDFSFWLTAKGYTGRCYAENIAQGQSTPGEVFRAWMNSQGHRDNILNPKYKDIGVASGPSAGGALWAMELGGC